MKPRAAAIILASVLTLLCCGAAFAGYHTVRKGDTAYSLSRKHGISVEEFSRLNPGLDVVDSLPLGEKVNVGSANVQTSSPTDSEGGPVVEVTQVETESSKNAGETSLVPTNQHPARDQAQTGASTPPKSVSAPADAGAANKPDMPSDKTLDKGNAPADSDFASRMSGSLFGPESDKASKPKSEPSVAVSFLRVFAALVFVAALAYVSLLLLKGTMTKKAVGGNRRSVRVVETIGLGANRTLHVVEVDGKRMLIGSTPSQMTLLTEVEATADNDDEPENQGFQSILNRLAPSHDRAETAGKVSRLLRDGAAFLQGKGAAARSMREGSDDDAS